MKKKKIMPLIREENKIHRQQKVCYICKNGLLIDDDG